MPRIRKSVQTTESVIWRIALYIRLSREDWKDDDTASEKKTAKNNISQNTPDVSRSIVEQQKMLLEYVQAHFADRYTIEDIYTDDGLSGTDDARDNFQRMMEDVENGKVNCIIVKTLSRAFRNYADQGRYLEQIFPKKGVRFISISNPFVDSFTNPDAIQNGMEIPINGLMNDRYAAKTSADIRRTFDAKRKRGEFIGAFAPYGYVKNPANKNSLIIDDEAAQIVRNIFLWFVNDGMSKTSIAKKLNELGVPNPTSYKNRVQHFKYKNPNMAKNDGLWCSSIILNMLTNQVYAGNMVQGRHRVISYKVHTQVRVPENEWYIVPGTHEAIIDRETFDKAQLLHSRDTRTAPDKKEVYLFSGFLRCADCKKAMRRKTSKNITYYFCRTKTDKGLCSKHTIREDRLTKAVLNAIRIQIALAQPFTNILKELSENRTEKPQVLRLNSMLKAREEELQKIRSAAESLYLDWKNGDITKEEYLGMKRSFEEKSERLKETMKTVKNEITAKTDDENTENEYIRAFTRHKNITALERGLVTQLIDTIYVHENGRITIDFAFADVLKRFNLYSIAQTT
ncbi:MAG: recombinase family protein [Clostridiales bacterium]|jgi:DNA invertase Pin-like site-specific DNA recombinase|nr:recombinase family protein [Clostridiales bacterium]